MGENLMGNDCGWVVLGDNMLYGGGLNEMVDEGVVDGEENKKGRVFGYGVSDGEGYGVGEFDEEGKCVSMEEKGEDGKRNYGVVGLYLYGKKVVEVGKDIKGWGGGELEMRRVKEELLKDKELKVERMGRGLGWVDRGRDDWVCEG